MPANIEDAIKTFHNSIAKGSDGIHLLHFKHSNPVPTSWRFQKDAIIIPILKLGNLAGEGTSYHFISPISPVVEILVQLLLSQTNCQIYSMASARCFTAPNLIIFIFFSNEFR